MPVEVEIIELINNKEKAFLRYVSMLKILKKLEKRLGL
jgi:hypothetical protein